MLRRLLSSGVPDKLFPRPLLGRKKFVPQYRMHLQRLDRCLPPLAGTVAISAITLPTDCADDVIDQITLHPAVAIFVGMRVAWEICNRNAAKSGGMWQWRNAAWSIYKLKQNDTGVQGGAPGLNSRKQHFVKTCVQQCPVCTFSRICRLVEKNDCCAFERGWRGLDTVVCRDKVALNAGAKAYTLWQKKHQWRRRGATGASFRFRARSISRI